MLATWTETTEMLATMDGNYWIVNIARYNGVKSLVTSVGSNKC